MVGNVVCATLALANASLITLAVSYSAWPPMQCMVGRSGAVRAVVGRTLGGEGCRRRHQKACWPVRTGMVFQDGVVDGDE